MTIAGLIKRSVLATALAAAMLALPAAAQASVARPWWHLATISAPAAPDSSEARIDVVVDNVGDAPTAATTGENEEEAVLKDETKGFVTVVDKLPAGVTATGVYGQGGGQDPGWYAEISLEEKFKFFESFGFTVPKLCSISGQTVECKYGVQVHPYEQMIIEIIAKVAPGAGRGENEVRVTGGGAAAASSRQALAVEAPIPSYGVQTYEVTPEEDGGTEDTQAGSHPFQMTTTLMFNTEAAQVKLAPQSDYPPGFNPEIHPLEFTKDLRFNLPPGLVGNPTPLPKCSLHTFLQFNSSAAKTLCPNNTVVGVATPIVTTFQPAGSSPRATSEPLYILEPSVGEPAKFGFPTPVGPVILDTSVRTGGGYGVVVSVPNITQSLAFIGDEVTFWGVPADARHDNVRNYGCLAAVDSGSETEQSCPVGEKAQPLLIMPTSCTGPLHSTVEADSWAQIGQFTSREYTFQNSVGEPTGEDGCNQLNFEPTISVAPDGQEGSTPTGLTVGVHVPQEASLNPEGLGESTVRDTTVTLPAGIAINPAGADGLLACGEGEVGLDSPAVQSCPEASKIGTVEIRTPLLPNPLVGAAYLAEQNANPFGSLLALYVVAYDPVSGVRVKLAGQITPDPVTGQLVSTFKETPQVPFENFAIHFFGGSRAPLGTPALCGGYTTTASIVPWSGNPAVPASSEFRITSGPNGALCHDPLPFKPTLNAGTTSIQAGGFSPFTMTMSREDGEQNLQSVQLKMPPGLLGTLSSVKLCGEAQADAGTCGAESLIGETTVSVGLGGNPYSVTGGKVYITGPYDGAPYGLSIVNPAKAGPFDLGDVVVRAKIEVDPSTAALTITTDPSGPYAIPHILDGIPLEIKHINVTIDRPDFTFNPTNCSPLAVTGSLGSDEGSFSALSVPFQITNCAVLAFRPKLTASTSGKASRLDGASLTVRLGYPAGPYDANIARVKVELPKALPSRLPTLQKACTAATFEANPANCPAASIIGHATATTPVIPVPLTGPAYFVSHGGEAFPSLVVVLEGYGATVDLVGSTFISKAGITSSTFKTIPDVPVGTFELTLPQGPFSALAANVNLCKSSLAMPTEFVGQNGVVLHQSTKIAVNGCAKARKATHKKKGKRKGGKRAAKGKRGKKG
ncbi:MAG TPA: hypothetical protein VNY52_03610 [Solirubrobacteraceae bacterium]|jgi:hypothetical protein|nr:hypothetical protein [Solirubrobacteraceae bacterium]